MLPIIQRRLASTFRKLAYNLAGFNKYGLYRDDLLMEDEDVLEALRRLPPDVIDERNYRTLRAVQLSIENTVLPKDQWIKYEDDVLYLTPIVSVVRREREEREEWERNY